jgi:hypothetical protein
MQTRLKDVRSARLQFLAVLGIHFSAVTEMSGSTVQQTVELLVAQKLVFHRRLLKTMLRSLHAGQIIRQTPIRSQKILLSLQLEISI